MYSARREGTLLVLARCARIPSASFSARYLLKPDGWAAASAVMNFLPSLPAPSCHCASVMPTPCP